VSHANAGIGQAPQGKRPCEAGITFVFAHVPIWHRCGARRIMRACRHRPVSHRL